MKIDFVSNSVFKNKGLWMSLYAITLLIVVVRNINNPGIGHEEAGQFWVAKGLNHFSELNAPEGNISQLIYNNRNFNFDPGGFTLILRYWTSIFGNNIVSLRTLPLLFLLAGLFFFRKLLALFKLHPWIVNLAPLLFLLSKDLISFGLTVRAYSMEISGIIFSLYFLSRFVLSKRPADLFYLFLILSVFAFSRYGFFIQIVTCSILILIFGIGTPYIFRSISFIAGILLFIFSLVVIYLFSLRYHLGWTNFQGPEYAFLKTFSGQSSFMKGLALFFNNLTTIRILPFTSLGVIVLTGWVFKKLPSFHKYRVILNYLLIYTCISIILSLLGLYPWDVMSRNSLPYQLFSILALCILLDWVHPLVKNKIMNLGYFLLIAIVLQLSFIRGYIQYDFSHLLYKGGKNSRQTWVDWMIYPVLKYNIRYGTLRNDKDLQYPDPSVDRFNNSYKYLIIDMEPRYKKACLERYQIKKYRVLKQVENDYLLEILE